MTFRLKPKMSVSPRKDGSPTVSLKDSLHEGGPRRVQCMMMGRTRVEVVCEAYPGMNPSAAHVWMSSSKTTTSILPALLEQQGLFSYDNRFTEHVPQLAGPAWDDVSFKNAANMMRFTPRRGQREGSNQEATMTRPIVKSFGAARQWRDRY